MTIRLNKVGKARRQIAELFRDEMHTDELDNERTHE